MPAGYGLAHSDSARKRGDAWVLSLALVGLGLIVVACTIWVIGKRHGNTNPSESLSELSDATGPLTTLPIGATPFDRAPGEDLEMEVSGEPGALPSGSLGWSSESVFDAPAAGDGEDGLWNATNKGAESLTPTTASDFHDPAIPTFDELE